MHHAAQELMEQSQDARKYAYLFDHGRLRVRWLDGTSYRHSGAVDMAVVRASEYNSVDQCRQPFFFPIAGWVLRCPKLRSGVDL